ncbi:MAG: hypothetical protein J5640_01245 [Bacteroidales bacterium]|nr:hypothetical protein [Bacteroidales bacterium]
MSPKAILLFALLLGAPAAAQSMSDRALIFSRDFSDQATEKHAPDGANCFERMSWRISRQLTGRDFYSPANYMFFRQAVKEIGFIPAVFATADRILRDSKLGTYDVHMDPERPVIEEGPEAYAPWRARE